MATAQVGPGWSQKPGTVSASPAWVAGAWLCGPCCAAFTRELAGSGRGSRAARTWASSLLRDPSVTSGSIPAVPQRQYIARIFEEYLWSYVWKVICFKKLETSHLCYSYEIISFQFQATINIFFFKDSFTRQRNRGEETDRSIFRLVIGSRDGHRGWCWFIKGQESITPSGSLIWVLVPHIPARSPVVCAFMISESWIWKSSWNLNCCSHISCWHLQC